MHMLKKVIFIALLIWGILFTIGGIGATITEKEGKAGLIFVTFILGILPLIIAVYFLKKKSVISLKDEITDDSTINIMNQSNFENNTEEYEHQTEFKIPVDTHYIDENSPLPAKGDRLKQILTNILKYLTIFFKYTFIVLKFTLKTILLILNALAAVFKAIGEAGENSSSSSNHASKDKKPFFGEIKKEVKMKADTSSFKRCVTCDYWIGSRNLRSGGIYVEYKDIHVKGSCIVKGPKYPFPRESGSGCPKWIKWRAFR